MEVASSTTLVAHVLVKTSALDASGVNSTCVRARRYGSGRVSHAARLCPGPLPAALRWSWT